jgi:hypothetical protein
MLTESQGYDVMFFNTRGMYHPTPLALNAPVLEWCKATANEIPDFDVYISGPWKPPQVVLSFHDPNAALAFKLRWL